MSRRRAVRRARRLQVHFWKQGDPTSYVGYSTNISMTGMFLATNSPLPSGSRIRVEILGERGFALEGVVAHARRVRPELARVSQSGMGVRFLSVEELVRDLIPNAYGQTEEIPADADRGSASLVSPPPPISEPLDSTTEEIGVQPATLPRPIPPQLFQDFPREPVRPAGDPPSADRPVAPAGGAFSLRFSEPDEFLEVYRRDILQGGLFVSTLYPARLQETVSVELFPPIPAAPPVLVKARVVQRFEPRPGDFSGNNLLAGMGLELLELPALVERLRPIVRRLQGSFS
jgi:PilZ domain-containing protein